MKTIITAIIIVLCLSINAKAMETFNETSIRNNLSDICPDAWCASPDNTYTFDKLKVKGTDATLTITVYDLVILKNNQGEEYEHKVLNKIFDCQFQIEDIIKEVAELSDETMEAISECIFNN